MIVLLMFHASGPQIGMPNDSSLALGSHMCVGALRIVKSRTHGNAYRSGAVTKGLIFTRRKSCAFSATIRC